MEFINSLHGSFRLRHHLIQGIENVRRVSPLHLITDTAAIHKTQKCVGKEKTKPDSFARELVGDVVNFGTRPAHASRRCPVHLVPSGGGDGAGGLEPFTEGLQHPLGEVAAAQP